MEYFDIYTADGQPIGQIKLRKEVHRDGDWHKAVDIWILNSQQELLLQKRSPEKESYPNLWEISCSGHISAGEESLPTALRELEEELGLSVDPQELTHLFSISEQYTTNNGTFINNEFKDVYLLHRDLDPQTLTLQKEEVAEVKFTHFAQLKSEIANHPENFVPHTEGYKKIFEYLHAHENSH